MEPFPSFVQAVRQPLELATPLLVTFPTMPALAPQEQVLALDQAATTADALFE